jgi:hypothetical protein
LWFCPAQAEALVWTTVAVSDLVLKQDLFLLLREWFSMFAGDPGMTLELPDQKARGFLV